MTDTRAAFEAAMREDGWGDYQLLRETEDDGSEVYCIHDARLAWAAWQAGFKHERSECAKVCEEFGSSYDNEWNRKLGVANDLKDACDECAAAIRARSQP